MKAKEIKELITAKQAEISRCKAEKRNLTEQYRDALQEEFESEHNVKSGDKITTKKGKPLSMIALLLTLSVMYAYFATTLRTTAQRVSQTDT